MAKKKKEKEGNGKLKRKAYEKELHKAKGTPLTTSGGYTRLT